MYPVHKPGCGHPGWSKPEGSDWWLCSGCLTPEAGYYMKLTDAQRAAGEAILDTKMDLMNTEGCTEEEAAQYKREARLVADVLSIFMDETADQIAIAALKRWKRRVQAAEQAAATMADASVVQVAS